MEEMKGRVAGALSGAESFAAPRTEARRALEARESNAALVTASLASRPGWAARLLGRLSWMG